MASFLGRGFRFPLQPRGGFAGVEDVDAVSQSLRSILMTQPGERVGRPTYGAGLNGFLFAPNTLATRTRIQLAVTDAIRRDEPRVVQLAVEVTSSGPERIDIVVRYLTIERNVPQNVVFPFYLDGTGA